MRIAAWNLNNKAGYTTFRPEAALAASELDADVVVFTEYHPKAHHDRFLSDLSSAGYRHHILSKEPKALSNRAMVASRVPIHIDPIPLPAFDEQLPANTVTFVVPAAALRVVGLRVPYYQKKEDMVKWTQSWDWIESTAGALVDGPALIIGDLNVWLTSLPARGGDHFRRLLSQGWTRAEPNGSGSCWSEQRKAWTEIDHALASPACRVVSAEYKTQIGSFELAGTPTSLSDHAALIVECEA